ncbi:LOW QUALITY PROTEIN: hypothetical protein CFOL_v3_20586 [Cephalotus follicularis]|uniref:Poor homologous synapsis 1 PH domain-containing protein n=1 Tax=Cephalotus follicularis TaxID=3775 RepID=A0A1Q3CA68_CEPFO|nr:LOW QUALITY PROTEIN: hypothetical protein CFOL_v3_20586 [Cephalotus follicularis]
MAMIASEGPEKPEWQVHFSRYFNYPVYPPLSSTCPSLIPLPHNRRYRPTRGTWISTSSHTASLRIIIDPSDAILSVSFRGKILEEHYFTKLHFSWPQVSCVSGFPARGGRAVFVTYKDSAAEAIKLLIFMPALYNFATICFSVLLLIRLEDATEIEPLNSDFRSEISSQSAFLSSNIPRYSAPEEELSFMTPDHNYTPQMPPSFNCEAEQQSCTQKTVLNHSVQGVSPALPPSFMSLLTNCYSEVKQDQQTVSGETDLKLQIVRYMEDHTFQDMLIKVEKVMSEMGDDLSL